MSRVNDDSGNETLGDKLYHVFFGKKEDSGLEIDNDDLIITKAESHDRILCILLGLGIIQMASVLVIFVVIVNTVQQSSTSAFDKSNSGMNQGHLNCSQIGVLPDLTL